MAIVGDTLLGASWVLFAWSALLGVLLRLALTVVGVSDGQNRARIVSWAVLGVSAVLLAWGYAEARRVPRVRRLDVQLPRLGARLDGTRVVLITDTIDLPQLVASSAVYTSYWRTKPPDEALVSGTSWSKVWVEPRSTWNQSPDCMPWPRLHRVAASPSMALDGESSELLADAVACQPSRGRATSPR